MTTNPHANQRDFTSQLRALADHLDHHPHLLTTGIYRIVERHNGYGGYEGLEVRLEANGTNGPTDLAAWAATFDGYESHAYRWPSGVTGHITSHIAETNALRHHLLEVVAELPADTATVAGDHGYERWTPDQVITAVDEWPADWPTAPARDVVAEAIRVSDQYQAVSPDTRVAMLTEIAGVSHQEARELVDQDGDQPTGGAE